jgi:hypothetical protein
MNGRPAWLALQGSGCDLGVRSSPIAASLANTRSRATVPTTTRPEKLGVEPKKLIHNVLAELHCPRPELIARLRPYRKQRRNAQRDNDYRVPQKYASIPSALAIAALTSNV